MPLALAKYKEEFRKSNSLSSEKITFHALIQLREKA